MILENIDEYLNDYIAMQLRRIVSLTYINPDGSRVCHFESTWSLTGTKIIIRARTLDKYVKVLPYYLIGQLLSSPLEVETIKVIRGDLDSEGETIYHEERV